MKSLDIINNAIKEIKEKIYKLDLNKEGTINEVAIYILNEKIKEYKQVKQDLEVLQFYKDYFTPEYIKIFEYNGKKYADCEFSGTDHEESTDVPEEVERFAQFKQWLEEQE